jgi:glucokinase
MCKKLLAESDEASVLRDKEVTAKEVFDAVKAGDALAIQTAELFGKYLGTGCAIMSAILDPEIIVIGGGVSKAGEILFEYVQKHFVKRAYRGNREMKFVLASLGNDAGIYGCARLVLE